MGIFSTSTPFDEQLNKATSELNTETDWGLILSICDKVRGTPKGSVDFAAAILPKVNHKVPHVSMQAITVLDACVNNCGKHFHKVVSSQNFTDALREILYTYKNPKVTRRLRYFIRKWADEFKADTELSHFVSFYYDLRGEGMDFPETENDSPTQKNKNSTSSDAVPSQKEADDFAKAIEESLKEEQQRKGNLATSGLPTSSLYPSMLGSTASTSNMSSGTYASSGPQTSKRKVKALYDFEAAEDNELTFKTGDIISILDDSDANWWKGEGANGSGLFPSNFVTSDLSKDVEEEKIPEKRESVVKFNETLEVKEVDQEQPVLEINETLIDKTLETLQSTDPENTTSDPEELLRNEDTCLQMGKLIDNQLETIDRKHLELSMLNEKILESLRMYDTLMNKVPVYPNQMYGMASTLSQTRMTGNYHSNTDISGASYINQGQPGPSAGVPQQAVVPALTQPQAFNHMYQTQPTAAYTVPLTNSNAPTREQQHVAVAPAHQNQAYPNNATHQQTMSNPYVGPQTSVPFQGIPPTAMVSQFHNSGLAAASPSPGYSASHVTSQPLM